MLRLKRITGRQLRIAGIALAAALALFALLGFLAVPPLLKAVLASKLSEALHRPVSIREVRANPFALSLTLRGLRVGEPSGPDTFLAFEELYVNVELASILRLGPVLREIRLTQPAVRLVRHAGERYNFSDLLAAPKSEKPAEPARPLRFALNNIQLVDGAIDFIDEPVGKRHTVRALTIGLPFFSSIPSHVDIFVEPKLEARINDDPYVVQGKTKPFADSLESQFQIVVSDLDIPKYLAYSPVPLKFKVPSGQLDVKASLTFARKKDGQTLTVEGQVALKGLAITDGRDRPLLKLPAMEIAIAPTEPLARKVHLSRVAIQAPEVTITRDASGLTNIQAVLPDAEPSDRPRSERASKTEAAPAPTTPPTTFRIDQIELTDGKLVFTDAAPGGAFRTTLSPIRLTASELGNQAGQRGSFALSVQTEAKETLQADGELTLTPLTATVTASGKGLALAKYAPYYQPQIRFQLAGGTLDVGGRVAYAAQEPAPVIQASDVAMTLSGLRLRLADESDEFVRIPRLAVRRTQADVQKREIVIGEMSTQKGSLRVTRFADGSLSLSRLLAAAPAPAAPSATPPARSVPPDAPWTVTLGRAALEQFAVVLDDRAVTPPATIALEDVRLAAEGISTAKNRAGKATLNLTVDRAASLAVATSLRLEPLAAEGKVEVRRLPLRRYAPYYRDAVRFDIEEGAVDVATAFTFSRPGADTQLALAGLMVALKDLRLRSRADREEFLSIPSLGVRNGSLDLLKREVSIDEVTSQGGAIRVVRSPEGKLNLLEVLPPAGAPGPEPAPAVAPSPSAPATVAPAAAPAPWRARIQTAGLTGYRVSVADFTPGEPVSLELGDIQLTALGLSSEPRTPAKVSLSTRVDKRGALNLEGTVAASPTAADLRVELKQVDVRPFQPYFTDRVRVIVKDGHVSAAGTLTLAGQENGELRTGYQGTFLLADLATVDKDNGEELLRWEALSLGGLDVSTGPLRVRLGKVALGGFYARTTIQPDGRVNLLQIMEPSSGSPAPAAPAPAAAAAAATAPAVPPRDIQMQEVTLQGGHVDFTDRSVTPTYTATLVELGGRVSGLSSADAAMADVDLRGRYEDYAPLEITGKINPLRERLFADLKIRYRDMDLTSVSPYSGKYIGYTIQKGKLSLELEYLIDGRKLDSQNRVLLDQFTLGDKVDSPHATRLPVSLAIALLKDRNGEIRLDLPVSGSLDDPKFSVWGVIFQILGNLLAKAATSPLALLGAAFGGGEELRYAEFEYGRPALTDASATKLETLAKAMRDRPGVRLDLTAYVDAGRDQEALRTLAFERKLRAQKALDLSRRGPTGFSVDQVTLEPKEYEKYLRMAYAAEKFAKPKNALGITKHLPVPEVEKLIYTHIQIGPEDLRALAAQRAAAAKEALVKGQVAPERIFIVEARAQAPAAKGDIRQSRVDFVIK
jgi:uncharacterized protein involved in outer membrane biogenesis